jgi:hypothetical protein
MAGLARLAGLRVGARLVPGGPVLRSSDAIAAEPEEVIDLIMG